MTIDIDELKSAIDIVEEEGPFNNLDNLCYNVAQLLRLPTNGREEVKSIILKYPLKTKTNKQSTAPNINHSRFIKVDIPSGACPVPLLQTTKTAVDTWISRIRKAGCEKKLYYTTNALIYFARQYFSIRSKDFQIVKNHILNTIEQQRTIF